jgi:hypothetical protein
MKKIPLTLKKVALVDDEDFAKLNSMQYEANGTGNANYILECIGTS